MAADTSRVLRGAPFSPRGRGRIPPSGCQHPSPGHTGPGLGPQTAGGISGEGKRGKGGDGTYSVETVRREAERTKCIPRFIGGLYGTFYYNLGDDSFLYAARYTAGLSQPVNVQRGPGLTGGTSSAAGERAAAACPAEPGGPTAPGEPRAAAWQWRRRGKRLKKKVRRKERVAGDHSPRLRSGAGFTAGASVSCAGSGYRALPAQRSMRACVYIYLYVCVMHMCIYMYACIYI